MDIKDGFYDLKQVLTLIPVSKSTWYQGIKEGRFPEGVKIGKRRTAWLRSSIQNLVSQLSK